MAETYRAYGLTVSSELALPELLPGDGPADVTIRYGIVGQPNPTEPDPLYQWEVTDAALRLWWNGIGGVRIRNGDELQIDPAPGVAPGLLRDFVTGFAMAAVLQRRGVQLLLHAGSVAIGGSAVAFCGESGEGKSTLTAAMLRRGYPLVADDMVPIEVEEAGPRVRCAFPRMKLTSQSAEALGCHPSELSQIHPGEDKFAWRVTLADPVQPLPLRRIYILESGDRLSIEQQSPLAAARILVQQSFHRRLLSPERLQAHLQLCGRLAREGYVRVLTRPRDLSRLGEVADLVEQDASAS